MRPSSRSSRPLLLFVPVLALVVISGCTSSSGGAGPGVVILGWEPELSDVFSDDQIDFLLKVQNTGESRARNVVAEITNIDPAEWGTFGFTQKQLGELIPFDPVTNTPGETETVTFSNFRAPKLNKGQDFIYEPIARISYDYATSAQKPVTIVDATELIRIKQAGQALPSEAATYTSGPLSVEIIMGDFVKSQGQFGFGQTYDIFPVHIRIRNTLIGSGRVVPKTFGFSGSSFFGDLNYPVDVIVRPPAGTNFVFSGFGDDCSQFTFQADLFRGEEAEITCELEVTSAPTIRTESLLTVELDYRYTIDASTQLRVQGTQEIGGFGFR
ncbi:MAG: hypothetical protein HY520_02530 [Candidatus Aenigmarchaeota archaeon]|nr:hypothetical protein [Candidatus Aenigmarchaeota archaeon]